MKEHKHKKKIQLLESNRNWGRYTVMGWTPITTASEYTGGKYKRREALYGEYKLI